jgi:hypothetical protein
MISVMLKKCWFQSLPSGCSASGPPCVEDHRKGYRAAYLPVELAGVGTEVEVEVLGERIIAQVTATLLVDPTGAKLRA